MSASTTRGTASAIPSAFVRASVEWVGPADPGFTLRTHTHLLPTSEDRTRGAIDKALGEHQKDDDPSEPVDGRETA